MKTIDNNEDENILSKVDVHYVVNILRHQSFRNPKIRQQDLTLCLQIVTKTVGASKQIIDREV